jgi:alpha-ribazole phosphatase
MSGDKPETIMDTDDISIVENSSSAENATVATDSSSKTIIELLRHGELEGADIFRGSTDDQLTDNGWQQMVSAIEGKDAWDIIITSPLSNCREFAEVIAQEDEIDLEINKQFKEIDFGEWEDKTPSQILKEDADLLNAWWQSPTHITPPNGEDFLDFKARVLKAFKETLQEYQGKRILIVAHSGVIRVIIMNILGMPDANLFSLNINNASFSKIVIEDDLSGLHGMLVEHS